MMIKPIKILGVKVHPLTMNETIADLELKLNKSQQSFVVTANAEIIMMCQQDEFYKNIINDDADIVLPDGAGAVWAGRYLGYQVPERVAGFDLYNHLLALSAQKGYKVYFFGGSPGIAEAAKVKAENLYPGVSIVGCHNGYFSDEEINNIIEEINKSEAQILFVALGAPKQEKWLAKYRKQLNPKIIMGIGGSFDVLAGKMQRAPKWMQNASLEWAFRLYKQPSRCIRMLALPKFVLKVIASK